MQKKQCFKDYQALQQRTKQEAQNAKTLKTKCKIQNAESKTLMRKARRKSSLLKNKINFILLNDNKITLKKRNDCVIIFIGYEHLFDKRFASFGYEPQAHGHIRSGVGGTL